MADPNEKVRRGAVPPPPAEPPAFANPNELPGPNPDPMPGFRNVPPTEPSTPITPKPSHHQ